MKKALHRNGLVAQFSVAIQIVVMLFYPALALAGPGDGEVVGGSAQISPDHLTVDQASDKAIINWNGFNINPEELFRVNQPGAESVLLSRDVSGDASNILGSLVANGKVFIVNPNGVVFGRDSKIDVAGILATTFNVGNDDFMNGNLEFAQDPSAQLSAIINQGEIRVSENGFVFLVAPAVSNEGLIIANLGQVVLGAGNSLTLDFNGDGLVTYQIDGKVLDRVTGPGGQTMRDAVANSGTIQANGGTVVLHAQAAGAVFDSLVNNSGVIEAQSLENRGGVVVLEGSDPVENTGVTGWETHLGEVQNAEGIVLHTGEIDVAAIEAGAASGTVTLSGQYVGVSGSIDAQGGGRVLVTSSTRTVLTSGASIDVSGQGSGDAGAAVVWSDADTRFYGTILGRGGELGGDGASVEVSGYDSLSYHGGVDLAAANGTVGTLLLDPSLITIVTAIGTLDILFLPQIDEADGGAGAPGTVGETSLEAAVAAILLEARDGIIDNSAGSPDSILTLTQNITLRVTNSNGTPDAAGITLDAYAITTTGSVTIQADTAGGAGVVNVTIARPITSGAAGINISTNDGNIILSAVLNSGAGNTTITSTTGSITDTGVFAQAASLLSLNAGTFIGAVGSPIDTDVASLFASTQNGGITISDVGATGLAIENVVAREGAAPNNTPVLSGGGQVTTNGGTGTFDVFIGAVGNVVLGTGTSPDDFAITTTGGVIIDGNQASNNLLAQDAVLTARDAIGQTTDEIDIISESTSAVVTLSGGVFLNLGNQGSLGVLPGAVTAAGAGNDVQVTYNGTGPLNLGAVTAPDAVTISMNGGTLVDGNAAAVNVTATTLTVTARDDVGTVAKPIDTTISGAFVVETTVTSAPIYITDTGTPTSVGATVADSDVILAFAAGTYTYLAAGDELTGSGTGITFENTTSSIVIGAAGVNAGAADVVLTAFTSISDAAGGVLTADEATLTAGSFIGTGPVLPPGPYVATTPLDTEVNTLTATASAGSVFIDETSAVTLNATATGTGNDVAVVAGGTLTVDSVSSPDFVHLQSTGGSVLALAAGTSITGATADLRATVAIGSLVTPLGTSVSSMSATATGGGLFVSNALALTMTSLTAGGNISLSAGGNLTLPAGGLSALGFAVTLSAIGDLSVGLGALTANSLNITARVVGTVLNHLNTATNTLTVASSGGAIYVDNTSAALTIVTATAVGFGGDAEITNTGSIALGSVTAAGDDVVLTAGGLNAITDNNGATVNVTAGSLDITALGGIGVGDPLEIDVDSLTANGGAPGAFLNNASELFLTGAALATSGAYNASSITIEDQGGAVITVGGAQSLSLTTTAGPIVMLNQGDTIAVTGAATMFIQAGIVGSEATAVLGNLTTAGGSVTIVADSHVTIGLVNAVGGAVSITSNSGLILDGNGLAQNIIGGNVTLSGSTPSARDLETDRETWFGRSEARDAELRITELNFDIQTATVATTGTAVAFFEAKLIVDQAAEASAESTYNTEQGQADTAELVANVASAVALGLSIGADIADAVAGPAQAIPLTGDGGAETVATVLLIAAHVADAVATVATFVGVAEQGEADDAHAEFLSLQATRISTESSLQLATLLDDDSNDALGVLTAALAETQVLRDQSFEVRDQMVAAEAAANAIGTPTQALGVSSTGTVTITAPQSSIYLTSPNGMTLGNMAASNTAGTADLMVNVGTAGLGADNLVVNGIIAADRLLRLTTLDGSVTQGGGSTITTDDLVVTSTTSINLGAVNADRFAASTGAGGVILVNGRALNVSTLDGVTGVTTAGGGVTITNTGTLTLTNLINAAAQDVRLSSTGSILSGSGGLNNVTANRLSLTASTGIGTTATRIFTTVTTLEATTVTGGINILNDGALTLAAWNTGDGIAVDVTGATGGINISTQSPLNVVDDVISPFAIVLTAPEEVPAAAGDILTLGDGPGGDVSVLIQSTASSVTLQGGDAIVINVDATVIAATIITADAGAGSVVDNDGAGSFTNNAGTLTAPSITINAIADVLTGPLTSSSGAGTLTVTTLEDIGVDFLNSWGNVILRAGTGGTGSIIDANVAANNVVSTSLTATAGDNSGVIGPLVAGVNAIELNTTIATLTSAEVANGGAILITDVGGGLTVTQAVTGTVSAVASGDIRISTGGGALTIASPTGFGASFYAASGVRNRGVEAGVRPEIGDGSGGTGSVFLSTTSQNDLIVGNGSLLALAGVPDIGALGGSVTIRTNTAGALADVGGQIRDGDTMTDVMPRINIIADGLRAEGSGGFGTSANPFETLVSTISGRFNASGWFLHNMQPVTVATVDGVSGIRDTDLSATFGNVHLHSANLNDPSVTISADIIAAGQVLVQSDETHGGLAGDDITVTGGLGLRVVSTTAAVLVRAGDSISIGAGAQVAGLTSTELTAGFEDNDDFGNATIDGTVGQVASLVPPLNVNSVNINITTRDNLTFGAGGLILSTAVNATATLTADSDNSGIGAILDADATVDVQIARVRAFAATGISLDTDITTLLVARLSVLGGTVDINELNPASPNGLALGEVTAVEGTFNLTAALSLPITDANGNAQNVIANQMVVNDTAGFGTAANAIETTLRSVFTTGAISGVFYMESEGDLDILVGGIGSGGALTEASVRAESILIGGPVEAANIVSLTAFGGAITSTGLIPFDVISDSMVAFSTLGIGESVLPLRTTNTAAAAFNLEATTNTGGVFYENVGPLVIGGVSPLAAGVLAIVGDIEIRTIAAGFNTPLTVTESVSTADNITLRADGIADAGAPPCFDDLTINAGTQVVSSGKDVNLIAEDDILIFGTVSAGDTLTATPAAPVDLDGCGSLFYPGGGGGGALFGIDVVITSPNDIDLGTVVAVNSVTLEAGTDGTGSVTDNNGGTTNIFARSLSATARDGISTDVEIERLTFATLLDDVVGAPGVIDISDRGGDMTVDVVLTSNALDSVVLSSTGGLTDGNAGVLNITTPTLTLSGGTGSIDLDTNIATLVDAGVSGLGYIDIQNLVGWTIGTPAGNVSAASGDIRLTNASGDMTLASSVPEGTVVTADGRVTLDSAGFIIDGNGFSMNVMANEFVALAGAGIGINAALTVDALETDVRYFEGRTDSFVSAENSINLRNTGRRLTIGGIGVLAETTGGGSADIRTAGPLTVAMGVVMNGSIQLEADETLASDETMYIESGVTVRSTAANVILLAGDNIVIGGQVVAATSVNLEAGRNVLTTDLDGAGSVIDSNGSLVDVVAASLTVLAVGGTAGNAIELDTTITTLTRADVSGAAVGGSTGGISINDTAGGLTLGALGASTTNGSIGINATGGNLDVTVVTVGGTATEATLTSTHQVTDVGGAAENDVTAFSLTVRADNTAAAAGNAISLDTVITNLTIAQATTTGDIRIADIGGGMTVLSSVATSGNQTISTTGGNLVLDTVRAGGTGVISLATDTGAITDQNGLDANVIGQSLTASAATGINMDTDIATLTAATVTGTGDIDVTETNGALLVVSATTATGGNVLLTVNEDDLTVRTVTAGGAGNVELETIGDGDVVLGAAAGDLVSADGNQVTLRAAGAVTDGNGSVFVQGAGGTGNNVIAAALLALSGEGFGAAGDVIETTVSNLEGSSTTGGFFLTNNGGLTIGGVSTTNGLSAGGPIGLIALSPITVTEDMITPGAINLPAGESAAADDITITATVASTGSTVTLDAGDSIALNAGGLVSALTTVTLRAGITADSGNGGSITDGNGGTINVMAESLSATAANAITSDVNVTTVTTVASTVAGAIVLNDLGGGVNVTTATTFLGDVTLTATGGSLSATTVTASTGGGVGNVALTTFTSGDVNLGTARALGDNVTVTAAGSIRNSAGAALNVDSSTLTATSVSGTDLLTNIDTLTSATVTGTGDLRVIDLSGDLAVTLASTVNGDVTIDSDTNLIIGNDDTSVAGLDGGVHAGGSGGLVTLIAASAIEDAAEAGTDTLNVSGNGFVAVAGTGLGNLDVFESNVRFFEGDGGAGIISLRNTGALTVGGIGELISTTALAIGITTTSPLTVAMNVTAAGLITLTAGETADAGVFADDLTINSGVTVFSIGDGVTLLAGDDIVVNGRVIAATTATLTAGFGDGDTGGSITDGNASLVNVIAPTVTLSATGITGGIDLDMTTATVTATVTSAGAIDLSDSAGGLTIGAAGVSTANGNIAVNATGGTLTVTGAVTAAGAGADVTLTTTNSGDIALGAGAANVTATDVVNLTASGSITDGDVDSDVTADTLNATAGTGIDLDTTIVSLSALVTGAGAINVSDVAGGLNVLSATTLGVGTITLAAAGGNLALGSVSANSGASAVSLTASTASITDLNGGTVNVLASTLTMSAVTGIDLDTTVTTIDTASVTGTGNIDINETNALVAGTAGVGIQTADGSIAITAADDLTATLVTAIGALRNVTLASVSADVILGSVTAAGDRVDVTAGQEITDGLAGEAANVTALSAVLLSGTGLGTADDIDTAVTNIEGSGGTGAFNLSNDGALTIGGVSSTFGFDAHGPITVTATSPLTVNEVIDSEFDVTLTAGEDGDNANTDQLTINASVSGHNVALNAGDDVIVNDTVSASENLTVRAGDGVVLNDFVFAGELASISTGDLGAGTDDTAVTCPNTLVFTTTGGIFADDILLTIESDLTIGILKAVNSVTITSELGSLLIGDDGAGLEGVIIAGTSVTLSAANNIEFRRGGMTTGGLGAENTAIQFGTLLTMSAGTDLTGSIVDSNTETEFDVTGRDVTASSTTGAGITFDAQVDTLNSAVATTGAIDISDDGGNLSVGVVTASGADAVTLTATGGITDLNGAATNNVTGASLVATTGSGVNLDTVITTGGTLTATASGDGSVSVRNRTGAGTTLTVTAATVAGVGDVTVSNLGAAAGTADDAAMTVTLASTANGDVTLSASTLTLTAVFAGAAGAGDGSIVGTATTGDILLNGLTAEGDSVTLTAAGAINEEGAGDALADIIADSAMLSGATGVGTVNGPLEVNLSTLSGRFATGGFFVTDTLGGLTVGTVGGVAGVVDTALASLDAITIVALSPLTIAANVTGSGTVTLTATESATPNVDNLTINADALVSSSGANLVLSAGDNVDIFGFVSAAAGATTITAGAGDLDGSGSVVNVENGLSHVTVTAGTLTVTALGNNGELGINLDTTTPVATLSVTGTTTGGIELNNTSTDLTVTSATTAATTGDGSITLTNSGGDLAVTTATTVATTGDGDITVSEEGGILTVTTLTAVSATTGSADISVSGSDDVTVTTVTATATEGTATLTVDADGGLTLGTATTTATLGDASQTIEVTGGATAITTLSATATDGVSSVDLTTSGGSLTLGTATTTAGAGDSSIDIDATGGLATITTLSSATTSGDGSVQVDSDGGLTLVTSITTVATTGDASLTIDSTGGATALPTLTATATTGDGSISVSTDGALTLGTATTSATLGDAQIDVTGDGGTATITTLSATATEGDASVLVDREGGALTVTTTTTSVSSGDGSIEIDGTGGLTTLTTASATATTTGSADIDVDAEGGLTVVTSLTTSATSGDGSILVESTGGATIIPLATTTVTTGDGSLDVEASGGPATLTTLSATATTGDGSISVDTDGALTLGTATTSATLGDAQIDVTGEGGAATITTLTATATAGDASVLVDRDGGALSVTTTTTSVSSGDASIEISATGGLTTLTTASATATTSGTADIDVDAEGGLTVVTSLTTSATTGDGSIFVETTGGATVIPLATTTVTTGDGSLTVEATGGATTLTTLSATAVDGIGSIDVTTSGGTLTLGTATTTAGAGDASLDVSATGGATGITALSATTTTGDGSISVDTDSALTLGTATTSATLGDAQIDVTGDGGATTITTLTATATSGDASVLVDRDGGALSVTTTTTSVTSGDASIEVSATGGLTTLTTASATATTTGTADIDVDAEGGLTVLTSLTTSATTGDGSIFVESTGGATVIPLATTSVTLGDGSLTVEATGGATTLTTLSATAVDGIGSIDVTTSGGTLTLGTATTTAGTGDASLDVSATGGATGITALSATATTGDGSISVDTESALTLGTATTSATLGDAQIDVTGGGGTTTITTLTATATGGDASVLVDRDGGALSVTTTTTSVTSGAASIEISATGGLTTLTTASATATTTGTADIDVDTAGGLTVVTSLTTSATTGDGSILVESTGGATIIPLATTSVTLGDGSLTVEATGGATTLTTLSATAVDGIGSIDVTTSGGTLTLGTATTTAGAGDASLDVSATGGATGITALSATATTGDGSISVDTESTLTLGTATTSATLGDAQIDVTGGGGATTITTLSATATTGNSSINVDRDGGALSVTTALTSISDGEGTIDIHGDGGAVTVTTATATATAGGDVDVDISATGTVAGFLLTAVNITSTGIDGDITLSTTGAGNMSVELLIALGDRVTLDSTGNVTDTDAIPGTNDISALELVVVADDGFGTAANPFETTVSFVEGTGGTLAFQQRNDGALTIGILVNSAQSGVTSTTEIDIRTTGAGAPESISVLENVESTASFVTLIAIDTAGGGFADDVSIDPFVTVTAATDLTVSAGDDIVIAGTLIFGAAGGAASVATLTAGAGDVDTGGSIVDLNDGAENLIGFATASTLTATTVGGNAPANGLAIDLDTRITTVTAATVGLGAAGIQAGGIRIEDTQFGLTVLSSTTELGTITLSATGGDLAIAGTGVTASTAGGVGNIILNTLTGMGATGPATSGNITLGVVGGTTLTALGDLVELNSVGNVSDAQADGSGEVGVTNNISAASLLVRAVNGFGTAAERIETTVDTVAGTFDQVGFFMTDLAGGLTIGTVTSVDGSVVSGVQETDLTNDGGVLAAITIQALSPLTVAANVLATGAILLIADEIADAPVFADDLTVLAGVTVESTLSSVELQAGDDILTAAGSFVTAFTTLTIRAGFDATEGDLDGGGSATLLGTHTSGAGATTVTSLGDIILGLFVAADGLTLFTEFGNILDGNGDALNVQANGLSTFTAVRGVIGLDTDAIEVEVQNGQLIANAGASSDRVSVNINGDIEPDGRFFSTVTAPGLELFNNTVLGGDGVDEVTDRFFKYTSDRQIRGSGEPNHAQPGAVTFLMLYIGDDVVNPEALYQWDASLDAGPIGRGE